MTDDKPDDKTDGGTDDKPTEGKRWCVYDTQLERFVGPVTRSRPSKAKATELAPNGHELRQV